LDPLFLEFFASSKENNQTMKSFKFKRTLSHTGVFLLLISAVLYLSINGFDFGSKQESAGDQQKYSEVRIFAANEQDFQRMMQAGLIIDHAVRKPGLYLDTWLSEQEIRMLKNSGVPYQILIDDWEEHEKTIPRMTQAEINAALQRSAEMFNISHSIYGTLRGLGHLKYSEIVNKLDSLRIEYPTLVSQKFSIGTSYENRTIWAVRITKNPDAPTGRPEVLYHAVIHAREPVSTSNQLYYIYWLVENYNTDPLARYILNNREIYWIPVFNPDGYVYNETGNGQWRRNRKPCGSDIGVDLNRNFGIYQFWNAPNGGSSTVCGSDTYRGPLPFSEPETQAVANFVISRSFKAGLGAHTYGNYLIKPWAWCDPLPTPDDAKFNVFLADATIYSHYTTGTSSQTLGYFIRGGSDDWYYQDSAHNSTQRTFVVLPETGTTGFWPSQAEILPLCQGMLWTNQYISLIAGPYVIPTSRNFNQATYNPGQSGTYRVRFWNKGLMTASNVKVQWTPVNAYVTIPTQQFNYASVASFEQDSAAFNFTVAANAPVNCGIPTNLTIKLDTTTIYTTPAYIYIGTGTVTLDDDAEAGIGNWTPQGSWAWKTDHFHSPTHSFGYAPYANNINHSFTLTGPINMQPVPVCNLSFWTRYDLESGSDFGYVEASSDNGVNWQSVTAFTGSALTWTQYSYDITQYTNFGTQVKIRFRIYSDASVTGQGWWIDDIRLNNYCIATIGVNGNNEIPLRFSLEQNYPNPFNPGTNIKFQLPKQEFVTIKVFDVMGREVVTLVNETKQAGYHGIVFNGADLSSGLYIYKIEAGDFVVTKKMILVK
jgi:hypothetical protein